MKRQEPSLHDLDYPETFQGCQIRSHDPWMSTNIRFKEQVKSKQKASEPWVSMLSHLKIPGLVSVTL